MQCADVGAAQRQNTLGLELFCNLSAARIGSAELGLTFSSGDSLVGLGELRSHCAFCSLSSYHY